MTHVQLQQLFDAAAPHEIARYWKSGYFEGFDDDLIEVLVSRGAALSPVPALLLFHMHGASSRVAPDATAFAARRDRGTSTS